MPEELTTKNIRAVFLGLTAAIKESAPGFEMGAGGSPKCL